MGSAVFSDGNTAPCMKIGRGTGAAQKYCATTRFVLMIVSGLFRCSPAHLTSHLPYNGVSMIPFSRALLVLLVTVSATASAKAQSPSIRCLAPLDALCAVRQRPGDAKLQLSVRLLTASGSPAADLPVSFTTSRCCVEAASTNKTTATGIATVVWSGNVPNGVNDRIQLYLWRGDTPAPDSIIIIPNLDVAYALEPVDDYFIWFRDDQIPEPVDFYVERTTGPITRAECDRTQVIFTPHLGGGAGPSPAFARWYPRDPNVPPLPSDTAGTCRVGASWRLANSVGEQHLNARLVGSEGPTRVDANVRATSRHPPRFVAGFGYFPFNDQRVDRANAIFGLDFPMFSEGICPLEICRTLRLVIGSTFENPSEEFYVAVPLLPLWQGSREALPLQVTMGVANMRGPFLSTTLDASGLLGTAIGRLLQ
jgi:hypothetical protein